MMKHDISHSSAYNLENNRIFPFLNGNVSQMSMSEWLTADGRFSLELRKPVTKSSKT